MNIQITDTALNDHARSVDEVVASIRLEVNKLLGFRLGTDTFGVMNFWLPPIFNNFIPTDGETLRAAAETCEGGAEAVRAIARNLGMSDEELALLIFGGNDG